jgi:glycosyltransferase involved in cell wall biosynthesis
VVVPNPVDASIQVPNSASRASVRKSLGLSSDVPTAIFVGDLRVHHNAEAVNFIARMFTDFQALRQNKVCVLIVGQFDRIQEEWKIPDLILTGPVRDLAAYIGAADVCIAPLFSQPTGIKTKVLTYLALGRTTVATRAALIGLEPSIRRFATECSAEDFPSVLLDHLTKDPDSTPNAILASMVQSLYGIKAVGMTYSREVLNSVIIGTNIVRDPSELPDRLS